MFRVRGARPYLPGSTDLFDAVAHRRTPDADRSGAVSASVNPGRRRFTSRHPPPKIEDGDLVAG
jgi:hypothetical protein